jgi:acetyltransferase-like isoleucine patch superfamily enzyme
MQISIVLEQSTRDAALALSSRWKKTLARVHVLEDGLLGLAHLVESSGADHVVLGALSSVSVHDPAALRALIDGVGDQLAKISVERTPIDMYCARRSRMTRLLGAAAERDTGRVGLRDGLFLGALHSDIDVIEDLPGDMLFYNDLMDYYTNNIWVVSHSGDARFHSAIGRLPELSDKGAESHIGEKGSIKNSWLASGVEVDGRVEDSIIFPNVTIRRNALVSRSVVLNGNRIGSGTEIHNALILPYSSDIPRPTPNIGDNCAIGGKTSSMKNSDFPAHIRDGIAVIGANADIPNGFQAEAASYVGPGVSVSVLRRLKVLRRGTSILSDPAGAGTAGRNGSRESA